MGVSHSGFRRGQSVSHETVLECRVGPLRPTLRLRGMDLDGFDVGHPESTGKLDALALPVGMVHAEDTVLVRVARHGTIVLVQGDTEGAQIRLGGPGRGVPV